jgi:plastocyanin
MAVSIKRTAAARALIVACIFFVGSAHAFADDEITRSGPMARATEFGDIEGTIYYRNDPRHKWRLARYYLKSPKTGELAEAVVALNGSALKRFSSSRVPTVKSIDQKEMRFVPETVGIGTGDRVRFTNSDPQSHNISLADPRLRFSDTIAPRQEAVETFAKASGIRHPFALGCTFHSQMQGWIYVFDHPFFQVTKNDGRFRLEHVPPGDYRLDVAHSAGELHASRPVHVDPKAVVKIEIILTPADRSPAE